MFGTGEIPEALGNLRKLEKLILGENELSGESNDGLRACFWFDESNLGLVRLVLILAESTNSVDHLVGPKTTIFVGIPDSLFCGLFGYPLAGVTRSLKRDKKI